MDKKLDLISLLFFLDYFEGAFEFLVTGNMPNGTNTVRNMAEFEEKSEK